MNVYQIHVWIVVASETKLIFIVMLGGYSTDATANPQGIQQQ